MTRIFISQSNYIPWFGYFAMISHVDLFVILDSVQFTRRDWRARNRIRVHDADKWLSIPVSGPRSQLINEVRVADSEWSSRHARIIKLAYKRTMSEEVSELLSDLYAGVSAIPKLTHVNHYMLERIMSVLGVKTEIRRSETLPDADEPSKRLARIAAACEAKEYWTGPAARSYLDPAPFISAGISVNYFNIDQIARSGHTRTESALRPLSIIHDLATRGIASTQHLCVYRS